MKINNSQKPATPFTAAFIQAGELCHSNQGNRVMLRVSLPMTMDGLAAGRLPFIDMQSGSLLWINPDAAITPLPNANLVLYP